MALECVGESEGITVTDLRGDHRQGVVGTAKQVYGWPVMAMSAGTVAVCLVRRTISRISACG